LLEGWNPRLREHLAQMAILARDEEAWAQTQVAALAQQILMPGRPVRGGGRAGGQGGGQAGGEGVAIEVARLAEQPVAMQRRLLRYAAERLGAALDFASTEALRTLALTGHAGQKRELAQGLRGERSHRELRLGLAAGGGAKTAPEYHLAIPGEMIAPDFGIRVRVEAAACGQTALLRNWRPGDRVRVRYSSAPRKVKEVLERLRVTGSGRTLWPVLEVGGRIVWMRGVELEPESGIAVTVASLQDRDESGSANSSHFGSCGES
jgi:tRNA(Ile)-lysidine synthase